MKLRSLMLIFFLLMPLAHAKSSHMYLLAVSESTAEPQGMVADLYLDLVPGSGRVFIDTFPLTKVDTQISTRFAKSIACNVLDTDCNDFDFIYTIRSNSVIIGGPSAGSALAVLTIAALEDQDFDEDIVITGTINSGGLIGPVGSLKEKITAASEKNLTMVLIPHGERYIKLSDNETNTTVDSHEFGKEKGIRVREVSTIYEAYNEFTGIQKKEDYGNATVTADYLKTMKAIAGQLCKRTDDLGGMINDINSTDYTSAMNLTKKADDARAAEQYYSQASFCFGANIRLSNQVLIEEELSRKQIKRRIRDIQEKQIDFSNEVEQRELKTLSDLQTYEIVSERLIEAEDYLKQALDRLDENETDKALYFISYSIERHNSAISWSSFFGSAGKEVMLSQDTIKRSCIEKLSEAEERYQYVQIYMPFSLKDTRKQIDRAYEDFEDEEFALCLFKASKAKAEADVILSAIGISEDQLGSYLDTKIGLVNDQIAHQQIKGNFPILGYSYFEYAKNLRESDMYSALVYTEYALELSNLDLYFNNSKKKSKPSFDYHMIFVFIIGLVPGIIIGMLIRIQKQKKRHIHIKIKRK